MRKYHESLPQSPTRPRRSRVPAAILVVLGLLASPLLYEGGKVLLGGWMSMTGTYQQPETPILDAISGWSRETNQDFSRYTSRLVNGGTWGASTAVPLAIAWGVIMGVVFLRRVR